MTRGAWRSERIPGHPAGRERLLLGGAALIALLVVALDVLGLPIGPLRAVAGLFLALVAPGAAFLAAVRPRFLAAVARAVLAIPMSLALVALAGVLLDRTPLGVTPATMAVASGALTGGLLAAGWARDRRRRPIPAVDTATPTVEGPTPSPGPAASPSPSPAVEAQAHGVDAQVQASRRPDLDAVPGLGLLDRLDRLPLPRVARAGLAHLRDPLFLNAYALGLSGVITSGLGVVYWAVAARLYPADVVGVNASLLSLVTLLANVSQLNLRSGFGRFVPVAGTRTRALIHAGYVAALVLAAATGIGVTVLIAARPDLLADVELTPLLAWLFPATVLLWTAFTVQDHALVALRRTAIVPIENGVFALAKVLLLVPLAAVATRYGILVSWTLPTAIGVALVSGWILLRLVPRAQAHAERAAAAGQPVEGVTARGVLGYVGADYLGSLFAIGSTSILPVLVLGALGATSSAHFYMVTLIAMATQLVPSVLATSLLVEVASSNATLERDGGRVLRQLAVLLGPIVIVLVLFAEPILGIFGASYAAEGATALRLMALAGFPYALINLAFIRLRVENRVRWVVVAQAVLAAMLIVPALVALPAIGITGLALVMLVSQVVVAAVLSWTELRPLLAGLLPDRLRASVAPEGAAPVATRPASGQPTASAPVASPPVASPPVAASASPLAPPAVPAQDSLGADGGRVYRRPQRPVRGRERRTR